MDKYEVEMRIDAIGWALEFLKIISGTKGMAMYSSDGDTKITAQHLIGTANVLYRFALNGEIGEPNATLAKEPD